MTLDYADRCAARLVDRFGPMALRMEIAGSVRRRRPDPNDIDIVVIPRIEEQRDLLGEKCGLRNVTAAEILAACKTEGWAVARSGNEIIQVTAHRVVVDFFFASPETFGSVLLCRTGSKEHNIWLAMRATARQAKWVPNIGLFVRNVPIGHSEEAIYAALDLPLLDPVTERDRGGSNRRF